MRTSVLIVAAGRSERIGGPAPKQFLEVAGKPLVVHCIDTFSTAGGIDAIILALPDADDFERHLVQHGPWPLPVCAVQGGATRQQSTAAALAAVDDATDVVVVHDGARPLVSQHTIREVIRAAAGAGAAIAVAPCTDTIKEVENGRVQRTLERGRLVRTQTPQAFRADWLREAHRQAAADRFTGTDDAALVERLGRPVVVVMGDAANLKVTTAGDLVLVEALLKTAQRTGAAS